jgi:antibiotic biosynthesis monooxygenase (ABM) superfamily enzyme
MSWWYQRGTIETKIDHLATLTCMWMCLFPTVTAIVMLDMWLEPTWPLWSRTLIATALAVPLIKFIYMPTIHKLVVRFGTSPSTSDHGAHGVAGTKGHG